MVGRPIKGQDRLSFGRVTLKRSIYGCCSIGRGTGGGGGGVDGVGVGG